MPEDIGRCRRGVMKNNKLSEYDYLAECKGQAFEPLKYTGILAFRRGDVSATCSSISISPEALAGNVGVQHGRASYGGVVQQSSSGGGS